MKKWISIVLSLLLTLTVCAGCGSKDGSPDTNGGSGDANASGIYYELTGIPPDEPVMAVSGNQIPAEMYFYWLTYNCSYLEYNLMYSASMGMYTELFDEDGKLLWDADFMNGQTLSQYALEQAENRVKFYATVENAAKENGVTLTEEDQTAIEQNLTDAMEQAGGEEVFLQNLEMMGISQETFNRITSVTFLYDHLVELVMEEGSAFYLEPEAYAQQAAYADHILLSNKDAESGELLSEEEIAAKRQTAEDLLAQLQAAEDLPTLFAQLADEYSEDPGRASNPDGYLFGKGQMVQEFEDAAFSLKPGELSGIVETAHGFHILLSKDVLQKLEEEPEQKAVLAGDHLGAVLEEKMNSSEIIRSEKLAGFDIPEFYNAYTAKVESLNAAGSQPEDGGSSGADDDTGSSPSGGDGDQE